MFILLTVLAVSLGWELNYIHQRREMRERIDENKRGFTETAVEAENEGFPPPWPPKSIPFWRRWLGDEAIYIVYLRHDCREKDMARAIRLFPEVEWALLYPDEFGDVTNPAPQP